jgi:hypothetical protein
MGLSVGGTMYKTCLILLSVVGCEAASDPPDPPDPTDWLPEDISESATVDSIGDAAFAKLCGAFEDYVRDMFRSNKLIQLACTAEALDTTTDAVACGMSVDDCLNMLPPVVEAQLDQILDQAGCTALAIENTGCQSTVGALKGCLDALGEQLDLIELELTCAAVGSPVPEDWWMIDPPAACQAITTGC